MRRGIALLLGGTLLLLAAPALMVADTSPALAQPTTARQFSFSIKQRKLDAADNVVRVVKGDNVELVFNGDEAAELHLHGYNIMLELKPGEPGKIQFAANIAGRFPLWVHRFGSGTGAEPTHVTAPLLWVEVQPR